MRFKMPCKKSSLDASSAAAPAKRHFRTDQGNNADEGHKGVERMCRLAEVSRASFYRYLRRRERPARRHGRTRGHSGDCARAPAAL
jgi:hypothetical protein